MSRRRFEAPLVKYHYEHRAPPRSTYARIAQTIEMREQDDCVFQGMLALHNRLQFRETVARVVGMTRDVESEADIHFAVLAEAAAELWAVWVR